MNPNPNFQSQPLRPPPPPMPADTETPVLIQANVSFPPRSPSTVYSHRGKKLPRGMEIYRDVDPVYKKSDGHTKALFLIKEFPDGPQICEIFRDIQRDEPDLISRGGDNCALVGSFLYDIGGDREGFDFFRHPHSRRCSNKIRYLDTRDIKSGWKTCKSLPFYCDHAVTAVSGNYIYILASGGFPFVEVLATDDENHSPFVCDSTVERNRDRLYIYDTVTQKARPIQTPDGFNWASRSPYCVPVPIDNDNDGSPAALIPLKEISSQRVVVFLHRADSWEPLDGFLPMDYYYTGRHYAVSNGIMYTCDIDVCSCYGSTGKSYGVNLYVYDTRRGGATYRIPLPDLDYDFDSCDDDVQIVPVSGVSKLCLLWLGKGGRKDWLHYARIEFSLCPPRAKVLSRAVFDIGGDRDMSCLPFDLYWDLAGVERRPKAVSDVCKYRRELRTRRSSSSRRGFKPYWT